MIKEAEELTSYHFTLQIEVSDVELFSECYSDPRLTKTRSKQTFVNPLST